MIGKPIKSTTTTNDFHVVYLTIIDLSNDYSSSCSAFPSENSKSGIIEDTLRGVLKNYRCSHEILLPMTDPSSRSSSFVSSKKVPTSSNPTKEDIVRSVTKFIKLEDQYCALCSLLLKSKAYHDTMQEVSDMTSFLNDNTSWKDKLTLLCSCCCCCCETDSVVSSAFDTNNKENYHAITSSSIQPYPVVSLPLTEYGKPYIPEPNAMRDFRRSRIWNRQQPIWNKHILSISHQFPFVASVKLQLNSSATGDESYNAVPYKQKRRRLVAVSTSTAVVGLDIAVWNPSVPSAVGDGLTSEVDALQYFRSSFSDIEWDSIYSSPHIAGMPCRMKEFHIRWSMKEAYTKSLGFGMALNFGSFEMLPTLDGYQNNPYYDNLEHRNAIRKFSWLHDLWRIPPNIDDEEASKNLSHRVVHIRHITPNLRWNGRNLRNQIETWNFWFLPLGTHLTEQTASVGVEERKREAKDSLPPFSLACICTGESNLEKSARNQNNETKIQVRTMLFKDLVCWHSRQRTYQTFA